MAVRSALINSREGKRLKREATDRGTERELIDNSGFQNLVPLSIFSPAYGRSACTLPTESESVAMSQ